MRIHAQPRVDRSRCTTDRPCPSNPPPLFNGEIDQPQTHQPQVVAPSLCQQKCSAPWRLHVSRVTEGKNKTSQQRTPKCPCRCLPLLFADFVSVFLDFSLVFTCFHSSSPLGDAGLYRLDLAQHRAAETSMSQDRLSASGRATGANDQGQRLNPRLPFPAPPPPRNGDPPCTGPVTRGHCVPPT